MPENDMRASRWLRILAASGALLAAMAVALAAYASHAAEGEARMRLLNAAAFALAHGIALAALASRGASRIETIALTGLLLGSLLFSGSLLGAYAFGWPTTLAPLGGSTMIASWLLYAFAALRR
jgi:uncharacterized membrane protein YgdD (TMEM256/DUF423 family)